MPDALLIYGDTETSTDLFHAIPAGIVDPFLYAEIGSRRIALIGHIDHETIRAVDPGIELLDTLAYGRRELLQSGLDFTEAALETAVRACRELGIDHAVVPWQFPVALADRLRAAGIELVADHRVFERRRRIKTGVQLDGIRRAQRAADAAMGVAAGMVRECPEGLTAEAVRAAMQDRCRELGCVLPDDVIVAVGPQSANGHDSGSGPIRRGDTVLIDIWPQDRASRCWADMTRTFVAGGEAPSAELAEYWELAKQALDDVIAQIRPGAHGRELHDLASGVFEAAGKPTLRSMGDGELPDVGFLHGLGHGVGLDIHEAPSMGLAGDELIAGDVVTVEPGCYRQGFGGVRLEDLVLVTEDGREVLTDFPYDL